MKLESAAINGRDALKLQPKFDGNTLNSTWLVRELFEQRDKYSTGDLACSAQSYLARGLAQMAIQESKRLSIKGVGFSGGVAYNRQITQTIRKLVEENGLRFFVHHILPAGDGCISLGQTCVAVAQEWEKSERI
jgi:hydrogenase maturation protein HypF